MANMKAVQELTDFIEKTLKLITRTRSGFDSQMCESCNSVKARYASKTYSWKISWDARIACAVLQINLSSTWRHIAASACHFTPLHPEADHRLRIEGERVGLFNASRREDSAQEKESKRRRAERKKGAQRRQGETIMGTVWIVFLLTHRKRRSSFLENQRRNYSSGVIDVSR
jgi:hypothetical protein